MRQVRLLSTLILVQYLLIACDAESIMGTADGSSVAVIQNGLYFSSSRTGNFEIYHLLQGQSHKLTVDVNFDSWWPRQSPDGSTMLFYRSTIQDRPVAGGYNNNY